MPTKLSRFHEIGHVLVRVGHPDTQEKDPGATPLPDTDHMVRMIRSDLWENLCEQGGENDEFFHAYLMMIASRFLASFTSSS